MGPSIDRGIDALDNMLGELRRRFYIGERVSHVVSIVDPTIDLVSGENVSPGQLGEYDFYIEKS